MYDISVSGSLLSTATISDEHAAMLPGHLEDVHISDCATASKDGELARVDFDYAGPTTRYMTPGNFGFGERVAYFAKVCQEINLGLEGTVIIQQTTFISDFYNSGNIQKIEVAEGTAHLTRGTVYSDGKVEWQSNSTEVIPHERALASY
jgi:hypothetical protein